MLYSSWPTSKQNKTQSKENFCFLIFAIWNKSTASAVYSSGNGIQYRQTADKTWYELIRRAVQGTPHRKVYDQRGPHMQRIHTWFNIQFEASQSIKGVTFWAHDLKILIKMALSIQRAWFILWHCSYSPILMGVTID